MKVPFCELQRGYLAYREEFDIAYQSVMLGGHYINGPQLEAFENEFSSYCGTKYALGVGNGLDALTLTLRALGIGSGDEVIVSAHTFVASWLAISQCNAEPIPISPKETGYLLDVGALEKFITPRTKAIMPVHLYGEAVDMTALHAVAQKYGIPIIEDAAQAHGAQHKGQKCGSFGLAAGFSFYPAKNLGAFGDCGAITTDDESLYNELKMLRNYGSRQKYVHEIVGYNSRLDEMQASFLRIKLRYIDELNAKRNKTAALYNEAFRHLDFIKLPEVSKDDVHVWHQYVITTPYRDALQNHLKSLGVETLIHYPISNHRQGAYEKQDFSRFNLEDYEELVGNILSLPIDAFITDEETQTVINAVCSFNTQLMYGT